MKDYNLYRTCSLRLLLTCYHSPDTSLSKAYMRRPNPHALSYISLYCLPSYTSHKLQPCDVRVFAPLKTDYRNKIKRLYHRGVETVEKSHFTSLYNPAR
jgi:hypothetical protein